MTRNYAAVPHPVNYETPLVLVLKSSKKLPRNSKYLTVSGVQDCEVKAQSGHPCAASFDWKCSGICEPVERITEVHSRCGEDENAVWSKSF